MRRRSLETATKRCMVIEKPPKPWHQHVVSLLESLSYHPLLTDPSCFRNDELASIENLRFLELCSNQVMMRIVSTNGATG